MVINQMPITALRRPSGRSPFSPDASLSRAVHETYCQCLLIAAVKRKTGGRFCSPPAPARLRRTSSDTKRFTRTVREADSSTGWREDEQIPAAGAIGAKQVTGSKFEGKTNSARTENKKSAKSHRS